MSKRVLGVILIVLAVISTGLAFSRADGYSSQMSLALNLKYSWAFRERVRCPIPGLTMPDRIPLVCPQNSESFAKLRSPFVVTRPGVRLGYFVMGSSVVALAGIGLLVFGKPSK